MDELGASTSRKKNTKMKSLLYLSLRKNYFVQRKNLLYLARTEKKLLKSSLMVAN